MPGGRAGGIAVSDKLLAFSFGVIFVTFILIIAWIDPNPSGFSYTVYRIVLSLAAAGVGAVIPGFITVRAGTWIRAGGAVALFVIVYFFGPAAIVDEPSVKPPPPETARKHADAWLALVDKGDYASAYRAMSPYFRSQYSQNDVADLISHERKNLGNISSRQINASTTAYNPPGMPKGYYITYGFKTKFTKEKRNIYEAVQVAWLGKSWNVSGFFTYVKTDQGQFVSYDPEN